MIFPGDLSTKGPFAETVSFQKISPCILSKLCYTLLWKQTGLVFIPSVLSQQIKLPACGQ